MLLSVHVPKTGGNPFRYMLQAAFGVRLMTDYGDWAGFDVPEANARRMERTAAMRDRRNELLAKYDVIHGHFIADKYRGMFPREQYAAFFRDPYQQSVAHYYFLKRNLQREHPEEKIFHEQKMTLHDYLRWDAFYNHQSQYLGSFSLEDFAFVGLASHFSKSAAQFARMFDCNLGTEVFANVNGHRRGTDYELDKDARDAVKKYRAGDIELYRRAKEIFVKQSLMMRARSLSMQSGPEANPSASGKNILGVV